MRKPTKAQLKIIRRNAKDTATHFKKDKWDLDLGLLYEYVAYDILGYHLGDVFKDEVARLHKRPIYMKFKNDNLVLSLTPGINRLSIQDIASTRGKRPKNILVVTVKDKAKKKKKKAKR